MPHIFVYSGYIHFLRRSFSTAARCATVDSRIPEFGSAWQIRDYNGVEGLDLVENVEIPPLTSPCDVLVEVKAASVNKLDVWMSG
jgi:hypothetical protein